MTLKGLLNLSIGVIGGALSFLFGGFSGVFITLLIFMAADYITGLIVAGVFKNSPKTQNGALESRAGLKGLLRKGGILLCIIIAARLDMLLGVNYVRDTVIFGFITNEAISITENLGLMGIPLPSVIAGAIELLKRKLKEE